MRLGLGQIDGNHGILALDHKTGHKIPGSRSMARAQILGSKAPPANRRNRPGQMTDRPPTLAELRRDIDRIDEAMHRLLLERGEIIGRLIAVKRTAESGSAFRPAREDDMLRRLVGAPSGM